MFKHKGEIVRGPQTAFTDWAHELTKNRRNMASPLHFVSVFALFTVTLQSPWIPEKTELITSL
jgi:hypothetical protein